MQLPMNAVGISDANDWLECPRRMGFKMGRHEKEKFLLGEAPEARGPAGVRDPSSAYGSAIHDAIHLVEGEGYSDKEAIDIVIGRWASWLEPEDQTLLAHDLETYHRRDYSGVRTIALEDDIRIPILHQDGETYYFRFKLDRLYQRIDRPTVFIHIDYKSSKWLRSKEEVDSDRQMWAYNLGVHDFWPECEHLIQVYDQLRGGQIPTEKNDEQREVMREWLRRVVKAILADDKQPYKWNQWCAWCPILESCGVVYELSEFALAEIAALAPATPILKQDGTPGKRTEIKLDPDRFDEYAEKYKQVTQAMKVLEKFKKVVGDDIKRMPAERQGELGFRLQHKRGKEWTPEAKNRVYRLLGEERASMLFNLTKTGVESLEDDALVQEILALADEIDLSPALVEA